MLLPLPAGMVRRISLENHLALATIRSERGSQATTIVLLRTLYMSYFLLDDDATEARIESLRQVEVALCDSIRAAVQSFEWRLSDDSLPLIEKMLIQHDEKVRTVPKYRYIDAATRMTQFSRSEEKSPLPGSRACEVWK